MKFFLFCFLVIPAINSFAQEKGYICDSYIKSVPIVDDEVVYSEIIPTAGAKDTLYNRAKSFLSSLFPNFKNVVKVDDRDLGKIGVRGIFTKHISGKGLMEHYITYWVNFIIEVKDGRYKYHLICGEQDRSAVQWGSLVRMLKKKSKIADKYAEKFHEKNEEVIRTMKSIMSSKTGNW